MKRKWWFLSVVLLTATGFFPGCDAPNFPSSNDEEAMGTVLMELSSKELDGITYCVTGDITATGGPDMATITLTNPTCAPRKITAFLKPGQYRPNIPHPVCKVTGVPAGLTYTGCEFVPPKDPFTIEAGRTTEVGLPVVFRFIGHDDAQVVFGVGAGDFVIKPGNMTTKYCGDILEWHVCHDGLSYCLDYNGSGKPKCYVLCDDESECTQGQMCHLVALPPNGDGGAGGTGGTSGIITIHKGDTIPSLDVVPGICLDGGDGGAGGAGGSGGSSTTGGNVSTGGSSSGGASTGGSTNPTGGTSATGGSSSTGGTMNTGGTLTVGGVLTTIRWNLPTSAYLASDVTVISELLKWGALCTQGDDSNSSTDVFECSVGLPPGTMDFDLSMKNAQSPTGVIWYGEENYEECGYRFGGDGAPQGTVTVTVKGNSLPLTLVPNPTFYDPNPNTRCESGANGKEMLTYNVRVVIPAQ